MDTISKTNIFGKQTLMIRESRVGWESYGIAGKRSEVFAVHYRAGAAKSPVSWLAGPEPICHLKREKSSRISAKRKHNANIQTTAANCSKFTALLQFYACVFGSTCSCNQLKKAVSLTAYVMFVFTGLLRDLILTSIFNLDSVW